MVPCVCVASCPRCPGKHPPALGAAPANPANGLMMGGHSKAPARPRRAMARSPLHIIRHTVDRTLGYNSTMNGLGSGIRCDVMWLRGRGCGW